MLAVILASLKLSYLLTPATSVIICIRHLKMLLYNEFQPSVYTSNFKLPLCSDEFFTSYLTGARSVGREASL